MGDSLVYNTRMFNPLFWHLVDALEDEKIRYIYVEGGSSAAKTFSICQALYYMMFSRGCNVMTFRRYGAHIKDSVYSSFRKSAESMELKRYLQFIEFMIRYQAREHRVRFRGLDDEEAIKGMEDFDFVYNNEWNQFTEDQWSQQRKRLRGKPNQKFLCDWNPISSQMWQYTEWLDKDEWLDLPLKLKSAPTKHSSLNAEFAFKKINKRGDSIWIKVTYRDNWWIVGHPTKKGGYVDVHTLADFEYDRIHKPNMYRVYANGERGIIRTGGELFKQFDETKHVRPVKAVKSTMHLSLDENVNPYVTVGCWQLIPNNGITKITQVHEIPCRTPDNNAPKAAKKTASWLRSINHTDVVFVYGDPSGSRRSTVDKNSKSFYDKFIEVLEEEGYRVVNRVAKAAPETALSYAFINDLYEFGLFGYTIEIGDHCKVSIDDYTTVQEDKNGGMLKPKIKDPKTGVTYEPHGHFSDQKKYFICKLLAAEFTRYKAKGKKLRVFSSSS